MPALPLHPKNTMKRQTTCLRPRPSVRNGSLAVVAALTAAVLAACGGSGADTGPTTNSAPANASVATAVYFTDDFTAEHDAVWITVSRVTAVGPAGETELLAYAPARPFNLPALRQAGALVANVPVPNDTTSVRVYVQPQARLQRLDGSMVDVTLNAPGGWLEFRLQGWNAASGVLALDFDLPKFVLQGNTLMPATRLASSADFAGWSQRSAELEGTVIAIGADALTLQTRHHGTVQVRLGTATTYWSLAGGTGWRPAMGERVEIAASLNSQGAALGYAALSVKDETTAAAAGLTKVEGVITAFDGKTITLAVRHSQHAGALGAVVFDVASAAFTRGSAALLAPGVKVEAQIAAQGSRWVARAMEVDGAPRTGEGRHGDSDYAEVKGLVAGVSGRQVTLNVLYAEWLPGALAGHTLTVDLADAYFKKGSPDCLVAGAPIEIKGGLGSNGELQAVKVEVEGGCASAYPVLDVTSEGDGDHDSDGHSDGISDGDHDDERPVSPSPAGLFVEAKGAVTAVRTGEFDIAVYRLEAAGTAAASLTVRFGPTTVFKRFEPASLSVGQFVEVKGVLSGAVIEASKVELD